MTIEEELIILEKRLQGYKNNLQFAIKNNNPVRATKYKNSVRETEEQMKQLEREIPIESNVRLRKIIDGLNNKIDKLQEANEELQEQINELNQRINNFINPPKPKPEPEPEANYECPACGRGGFKGVRGVKAHQSSGACSKSRKIPVKS